MAEDQGDLLSADVQGIDLSRHDLSTIPDDIWPRTLARVFDANEAAFLRAGYSPIEAAKLAGISVGSTAFEIGGEPTYFPRGDKLKVAIRDNQAWSSWRRHGNMHRVMKDFRMTSTTAYRVIEEQHKLYIERTQHKLPFKEE